MLSVVSLYPTDVGNITLVNADAAAGATAAILKKTLEQMNLQTVSVQAVRSLTYPFLHRTLVERALTLLTTRPQTIHGEIVAKQLARLARTGNVDIVCYPEAPGQFLCNLEDARVNKPVIVWDPFKAFQYYGRTSLSKKMATYERCAMPPWMVLAHELGHYKQYLDDPNQFGDWLGQGAPGIAELENDNLTKHEAPLLTSIGKVPRAEYSHFRNIHGFEGTAAQSYTKVAVGGAWAAAADTPPMGVEMQGRWTQFLSANPTVKNQMKGMRRTLSGNDSAIDTNFVKNTMETKGDTWPAHVHPIYAAALSMMGHQVRIGMKTIANPFATWLMYRHRNGMPV